MLARVEPRLATPLTPSLNQAITVTYDPIGSSPTTFFTFDTSTGKRFLFVDESTTITVTLVGGTFAPTALTWILPPPGVLPPTVNPERTSLSFDVDPPAAFFSPWVFRLNIDSGGINGITSPTFLLINAPTLPRAKESALTYSPADGIFTLDTAGELRNELLMINPVTPFTIPIALSGASFPASGSPIVWITGEQPDWITVDFDPDQPQALTIFVHEGSAGRSIGLKFVIEVDGQLVLSPDPILINATTGDG